MTFFFVCLRPKNVKHRDHGLVSEAHAKSRNAISGFGPPTAFHNPPGAEPKRQAYIHSILPNSQSPPWRSRAISPQKDRHSRARQSRARRMASGGAARGRLAEERKAWRKSHPHVRARHHPRRVFLLLV